MDNRPIGVFDSGLGGLTGVRELRKRLPNENIVYFGDTGRVPYGSRSPETILQYARQDIAFLLSKDVKCIMAACGTVSSIYPAAEAAKLPVPYLGVVDAAAREAAFVTRNRRIGVIGTAATIRSRSYETVLRWYMGRNVTLVDPAQTAAHHLERTLSEHGLKGNHEKGEAHFYVSDVPDSFAQTADLFLGEYKGGLIDQIAIDKY